MRKKLKRWITGHDEQGMNIRLLWRVERRIRRHPENYNQGTWFESAALAAVRAERYRGSEEAFPVEAVVATRHLTGTVCGTKACVAGHALVMSGRVEDFTEEHEVWALNHPEGGYQMTVERNVDWSDGATEVLGLDTDFAMWLFSAERDETAMPDVLRELRLHGATRHNLAMVEDRIVEGREGVEVDA